MKDWKRILLSNNSCDKEILSISNCFNDVLSMVDDLSYSDILECYDAMINIIEERKEEWVSL